jgi:LL-H family phage holin
MDQAVWDFINQFLLGAIGVLAPIVLGMVAVWLKQKVAEIKVSMRQEDLYLLESLASVAVKAAEQAKLAELITDKKTFAVNFISDYLESQGMKFDVKSIAGAVEAAVLDKFNSTGK